MKSGKEETLRAQLEMLDILGDSGDDYLYLWEMETGRVYLSKNISRRYPILADGEDYCSIEDWYRIVYEKDLPNLRRDLERVMQGATERYSREYRLVDRERNRVWVNCRGRCQVDEQGKPVALIGRVSDTVLEQKVDPMTGAFNAGKLAEDIERILETGIPCYLLLMGVDNLKHINLRHGREYGSQILCLICDTLEELVGTGLRIYRVNGDCFAVNLPATEEKAVEGIYREISSRTADCCTISAGVVSYQEHAHVDCGTLYQYAEDALDRAKRMGKDTLAFFSREDHEERLSTMELQEELQQSVQEGFTGFSLCYQPQIRSRSYELFGAEALLRYHSPTRGPVSPVEFIPVLEQTGMICPVGLWVLETALHQCRIWRASVEDAHISVNISYTQLNEKDIAGRVLELLEESGLPGEALTLEVTESIQLQDYPRFNKIFYLWKQAGIEISVDDFGTGYSSLGYLKNLDIDEIKIDRCFVSGIQHSAYNYRLLSNMLELARSSQIRVCCEGVESSDELAALEELGPDILQGFLFSRPLTQEKFYRTYIQQDTEEYQTYNALKRELHRMKWSKEQLPKDMCPTTETLESIVEALDEIVFVSDVATYELYYLNPAGQRLTGVYDYKGRKCYKVIQGKDDPCDFCTNGCLQRDQFHIWEQDNKELKRHFIFRDKLLPWRGKLARLEVAVDISQREILSSGVREKLDFAENMLTCAKVLAEEPDMAQATRQMLRSMVEFYQADRAYLMEPEAKAEQLWSSTYEWCADGVPSARDRMQKVTADVVKSWVEQLGEKHSIILSDPEGLRQSYPVQWERLRDRGIHCLIAAPIWKEGHMIGMLGVDNPRHCSTDDALIRMLSLFVVNRLSKNETKERLDELMDLHYRDVLKDTELGLWFIRIDPNSDRREMFADETMRRVMGLERPLPPQECYAHWYSHINDGYYEYVNLSVESMMRTRQVVQLEYSWLHPTFGEVMVRGTGIRTADAEGMICLEGYHRIISNMERPQLLPDTLTGEVFEFNERKGTIYFHTKRTLLAGENRHACGFPQCWLEEEMVHPHFAAKFAELFRNVQGKEDTEGEEFLMRTKEGGYDWFKLRTRHLGTEEQDRDTILVLLDAAERERVLQLENMRIRDFYQASLSEAIAYAEVDLESGQLRAAGGLWTGYDARYDGKESLLRFMLRQSDGCVRIEEEMEKSGGHDAWKAMLSGEKSIQRFRYQRLIDDEWRWVELVAHSFREQFTENAYALLYLKDIDAQVRKEQAQQEAANRDPLTGIYNRNAFQHAVCQYMEEQGEQRCGVLILLDLDNFKIVNDQFGHLEGDAVLQYVTKLLESTFRSGDIVGRLGGDEFMIFLKGHIQREILDQRMEKLYGELNSYPTVAITCSAGVTFVEHENFSYRECIHRADMALYKSKQDGKCHYTYVEEPQEE